MREAIVATDRPSAGPLDEGLHVSISQQPPGRSPERRPPFLPFLREMSPGIEFGMQFRR